MKCKECVYSTGCICCVSGEALTIGDLEKDTYCQLAVPRKINGTGQDNKEYRKKVEINLDLKCDLLTCSINTKGLCCSTNKVKCKEIPDNFREDR